ncbi:MAG TPA: hypothetical protein VIU86_00645 [Gaiellaceae bacterium]
MTYELVNQLTTNSLASFETEREAVAIYREFAESDPDFAADLLIVRFDEEGEAVEAHPAAERSAVLA